MPGFFVRGAIHLRKRLLTFKCLAKTLLGRLKPAHNFPKVDLNVFDFDDGVSAQA